MAINPSSVAFDDANGIATVVSAAAPLPVGGGVASGTADSGNPVKIGAKYNSAKPTFTDGQRGDLQMGTRGSLQVTLFGEDATGGASVATPGSNQSIGASLSVRSATMVHNGVSYDQASKASSTSRIVSAAATTNATSAKVTAGTVYTIDALNTSAAVKFLKLYNKASAPTVGTDTPVRTIALPPSNASYRLEMPTGLYFSTGIAYALTGAAADADTTALAAGDVVGLNIDYS